MKKEKRSNSYKGKIVINYEKNGTCKNNCSNSYKGKIVIKKADNHVYLSS